MKTYTTQEAAELTGSSVRALRKRIERGQLRAVQHGRYWRIPHGELERCGLVGPEGTQRGQGTDDVTILAALERERAECRRLAQEVARLRPLTAHVEQITEDLLRERAERLTADARAAEATSVADELRERERQLAAGGFFARRRLLRELRRSTA
ncbi:MAG: helix-turn-helix domain-containing protein [Solirubrobacteraceae bacterium]